MIQINQLKLPVDHSENDLKRKILKILRIKEDALLSYRIKKQSLDARKKPELFYVYSVNVNVRNESAVKKKVRGGQISFGIRESSYEFPVTGNQFLKHRPVVIGTGPAGLFCGYMLALSGYRPILLERGADVTKRMEDVERFWNGGTLDPNSNVQLSLIHI